MRAINTTETETTTPHEAVRTLSAAVRQTIRALSAAVRHAPRVCGRDVAGDAVSRTMGLSGELSRVGAVVGAAMCREYVAAPECGNAWGRGDIALTMNKQNRGYFGIGIENTKTPANLGTLWRSAYCFGAAFLFTIHQRWPRQASDTCKAWRHVPLIEHGTFEEFRHGIPRDCVLVGIELDDKAKPLKSFQHPERAVYLLGAEDYGLSTEARKQCHVLIQIDSIKCLNVATAGSIVMWHRVNS